MPWHRCAVLDRRRRRGGADVAVRAAEESVELQREIGMTWEHPADVYPERARAARSVFGRPGF
ncbi:hypothetical protein ACWCQQ_51275, partial [Streptomyces sp. NPDC002143]